MKFFLHLFYIHQTIHIFCAICSTVFVTLLCARKSIKVFFVTASNFWGKWKKDGFQYKPWYCDLPLFDLWSISVNLSVIRSNWKRKVNSQQQKRNCLLSIPYNIPSFSDRKPCKSFFFLDSLMYNLLSCNIRTIDKAQELKYFVVILWKCLDRAKRDVHWRVHI